MSLPSLEQLTAEILTTAAIDIGAHDAPTKSARAATALAVAAIIQTASTGDISTALSQFSALVVKTTDPGVQVLLQNLLGIGQTFLSAQATVMNLTPVLGGTVQGLLAQVAAGMTVVASKYPQAAPTA